MPVSRLAVIVATGAGAAIGAWAAASGAVTPSRAAAMWTAWHWDVDRMKPGLIIFVLFSLYWGIASKNRAPDKTSESGWSTLLHQLVVGAGAAIIILPIPGLTHRLLSDANVLAAAGTVVVAGGALLAIVARRALGAQWSAEVRIARDHRLIQAGPYRYLRHPIYTGALCMYVGLTVASGTVHAMLGLIMIALAYWRKTMLEERILQREFGADFDAYRRKSSCLVPFVL